MDTLTDLLDEVRARSALVTRTALRPHWSVRFASGAALTLLAVVRGEAWIVPAGGDPVRVRAGDVAILRGPAPYTVAAEPGLPPDQVVTLDDYCAATTHDDPGGPDRSCGPLDDAVAVLLSGAYDTAAGISPRLLDALPDLLVAPEGDSPDAILPVVGAEIAADRPGQQVVLDRLLDLLLVSTLRGWFDTAAAPPWYGDIADPVVGPALRLLHDRPSQPWTVHRLAAETGVSRAFLARRFTDVVGEAPMRYLTGWRLSLAADLLRETDATIDAIARSVGYGSAFALSAAFKRRRGLTPSQHRAATARIRRP